MISRFFFWLNNARLFSLPMTYMSWLVVFLFALIHGGNPYLGVVALIGISFAHLATNLCDDYFDYLKLTNSEFGFGGSPQSKCAYIRSGEATIDDLFRVICFFLSVAFLSGVILTFFCGWIVPILTVLGGFIVLLYSKMSGMGLSEIAVALAFGPLLFEGTYFVMAGNFSLIVLFMSFAVGTFTVILLYVHTLLDFDGDMMFGKKTLACRFGNKFLALKFLFLLFLIGYLFVLILFFLSGNYYYFITYLTIPYAVQLYREIYSYNLDSTLVPKLMFLNFPMEKVATPAFHHRLFLARNLMVNFSILMCLAVVL